ncbi:MAG TPA: twin-arginine translocase subunit TatC [Vicinamibacterales bacterium]|nr:twin-arginine translocase subunit TatC [Vicinamibacterales bacterium]
MPLVPAPGAPVERADDPEIELTDPEPLEDDGARMSFLEHLDELRKRLIHSALAILVGCGIAFTFLHRVIDFLTLPMRRMLPEGGDLVATAPSEYFFLYIKLALLVGLFIALPVVMLQVWLFIAPGLYAHEKRLAVPFVAMSSVLFTIGAAFSHYVAFPWTWQFFMDFMPEYVRPMIKLGDAFSLYVKMVLAFGVIFQMPTVVLFLARMGVVTAGFLARRTKYAVLIIFILAAVLSPGGDVVSQALMAGPMLVLYALSIGIAWLFGKRQPAAD